MDSVALVGDQIGDGRKLINSLTLKQIDVTAAAWIKTSEEGNWYLYIATDMVDNQGLSAAYGAVFGVLRELPNPFISTSQVKLVESSSPLARDLLKLRRYRASRIPAGERGSFIGGISIDELYIYPEYEPNRQLFTLFYTRQGETSHWKARTRQGELFPNTSAKGAISYTTSRWEGEQEGAEKFASVGVLLEVGPQFDDAKDLDDPNVQRVIKQQAAISADEMFKVHHPDAEIDHLD